MSYRDMKSPAMTRDTTKGMNRDMVVAPVEEGDTG